MGTRRSFAIWSPYLDVGGVLRREYKTTLPWRFPPSSAMKIILIQKRKYPFIMAERCHWEKGRGDPITGSPGQGWVLTKSLDLYYKLFGIMWEGVRWLPDGKETLVEYHLTKGDLINWAERSVWLALFMHIQCTFYRLHHIVKFIISDL